MDFIKDEKKYNYISDFVNCEGTLEIGFERHLRIIAFAYNEGETIWQGKQQYSSLDQLLEDANKGIGDWIDKNW